MVLLDSLREFIQGLDSKELKRYIALYIGLCVCIIISIVVRHVYLLQEMEQNMKKLQKARKDIQIVFSKYQQVEQQKNKIDTLLKKDKFYIQKFFQDMLQKLHLGKQTSEKLSTQKLENGYTEESLNIALSNLNTKDLCDLLQAIEQEQRVYIKSIEITKAASRSIQVSMSLATLIPKAE